ncbi:MAG TPA: ankyrin repeat domain-containing protein [Flavobacterium sp.]|jgi:ankyrin repeat protein
MKKSLFCFGIALLSFSNGAFASVPAFSSVMETSVSPNNQTPLCRAISKGDTEIVRKFVEYGIDVNERSNGMTPLMIAARYNHVEIIKILVDNGADVNAKNDRGFTALQLAQSSNASAAAAYLSQLPK